MRTGTGKSKYEGVHWDKNKCKWTVRIKWNGVMITVGTFEKELQALKERNKALAWRMKYLNRVPSQLLSQSILKHLPGKGISKPALRSS